MSFFALLTKFKALCVAVVFCWQKYVVDFQVWSDGHRLGRLEGAKKHLQIAAQQHIDMGDMQRVVEKVEKHLQNCYNARSAADWSAVVREMDAAIVAGADSAPQVWNPWHFLIHVGHPLHPIFI